nr:AbrB family transcriptional regulator [Cohnella faecalis]
MNKIFASRQARTTWTLFVAIVSGLLFDLIHMPIPWLLGPMLGTLAVSKGIKSIPMFWPGSVRNAGLIIVGYSIGISFTLETLKEIGRQLPAMALMTLLLLLLCLLIAILAARLTDIPFPTVLTGCIPGGLTQIVSLAEETKGIDVTIVTFLQVTRLMMIVVFIPILAFGPLFGSVAEAGAGIGASAVDTVSSASSALFPEIAVYAVVCTGCALIGQKIRFPTAFLLGPMIAAAVLHISGCKGSLSLRSLWRRLN